MSLNIVFMGTPEFAVPTLKILFKNKFNIIQAYTQPPKKSKRGQKINPSPVELFCKENNVEALFRALLKELKIEPISTAAKRPKDQSGRTCLTTAPYT